MKSLILIILLCCALGCHNDSSDDREKENHKIIEGKGIQDIVQLGEPIENVQKVWGKPDLAVHDDWPGSPYDFYEYYNQGVLFTAVDQGHKIVNMTFYPNPYQGEKYKSFQGQTASGLILRKGLSAKKVFEIYGKPSSIIDRDPVLVQKNIKNGKPFIINDGKAGLDIHYPKIQISFHIADGLVQAASMGTLSEQ